MIELILSYISDSFDFGYIISINLLVYFIVKGIEYFRKNNTNKFVKIVTTIIITIILGIVYKVTTEISNEKLINSSILAPVAWDWIIKPLCRLIKIDYKEKTNGGHYD